MGESKEVKVEKQETETAGIETAKSKPLRRTLFTAGPIGLLAALVNACSQDAAKFGGTTIRRAQTGGDDLIVGPNHNDPNYPNDPNNPINPNNPNTANAQSCLSLPQINDLLSSATDLQEGTQIKLKFYGIKDSLLLAMRIDENNQSKDFKLISLLDEDGYPLASQVIPSPDKLKLLCFDNLRITGNKIHILLSTADNKSYRKKDLMVIFDDQNVTADKPLAVVSPLNAKFTSGYQFVANFDHQYPTNHKVLADIKSLGRSFYIADTNTTFEMPTASNDFMIKDLLGEEPKKSNAGLDIIANGHLVAYRADGAVTYRTIIRMT